MKAFVSIHDLMPHTMERVEHIISWLDERNVPPVMLLVVPGRAWSAAQINRIRELANKGHELAAHGWLHETKPKKLFHRIHAALISRNVAEHLDLDSAGVLDLLIRSKEWFKKNDLPPPSFYVPPAWALGPISKSDLAKAPFDRIETTRGIIHLNEETYTQSLPLTGYEADTPFREFFLRRWNRSQAKKAARKDIELRISIHPDDLTLRVADQLEEQISLVSRFV